MQKFEYVIWYLDEQNSTYCLRANGPDEATPIGPSRELEQLLNAWGEHGWEVIAATGDRSFRQILLKRRWTDE